MGSLFRILPVTIWARIEGKTLTDQVSEYFESVGGKAISPLFGEVTLDKKGADDSFAHGMGRLKAVAHASVKDVIEYGILIESDKNGTFMDYIKISSDEIADEIDAIINASKSEVF